MHEFYPGAVLNEDTLGSGGPNHVRFRPIDLPAVALETDGSEYRRIRIRQGAVD